MRRELRVDVSAAAGTGEQLTVAATVLLPDGPVGASDEPRTVVVGYNRRYRVGRQCAGLQAGVNRRLVPVALRLRLAFQIAAAVPRTASVTTPHRIRPAGPVTETAPIG